MIKQFAKLLFRILLIAIITGTIIYCINSAYVKNYWTNPFGEVEKYNNVPYNIKISNIGSSHGINAFHYEDLESQGFTCFNFSLASQSYDYDFGLIQMYQDHFEKGGILFIPVSYFSFNNEVVNDVEKKSMSSRYYSFMKPKYIPNYSLYTDFVIHKFPVLSSEENFLDWIFSPLLLKVYASEDTVLTQEEMIERANQRYDRHFNHKTEYILEERIENLEDIVTFCNEKEVTPVLVTLPVCRYYYELIPDDFFPPFYDAIDQVCKSTGVNYYDYGYDARFRGNLAYFFDSDHLSKEGSAYFMSLIAEEIPEYKKVLNDRRIYETTDQSK